MGRVQLFQSIINGMLLCGFQIYLWPVPLIKLLDKWIKNFVWSGDIHTKNVVTVAWNKVCMSLNEGGLGMSIIKST